MRDAVGLGKAGDIGGQGLPSLGADGDAQAPGDGQGFGSLLRAVHPARRCAVRARRERAASGALVSAAVSRGISVSSCLVIFSVPEVMARKPGAV